MEEQALQISSVVDLQQPSHRIHGCVCCSSIGIERFGSNVQKGGSGVDNPCCGTEYRDLLVTIPAVRTRAMNPELRNKNLTRKGSDTHVMLWSIPQKLLEGAVEVMGTNDRLPLNWALSGDPKSRAPPTPPELDVVRGMETPTKADCARPC